MTKTKFHIHPFEPDPSQGPLYAIIPDDDTPGWVIGELDDVQTLADRLNRFLETQRHDGEIDEFDERLGSTWIDIAEAVLLADAAGKPVAAPTIRAAAAGGKIRGAKMDGKTWRFPRARFYGWLHATPGVAGRPRAQETAE